MPIAPITATLSAVGSLFGLNYREQIDALDRLAGTLTRATEPAAEKLALALGEIDKMLTALDGELVRYLALRFAGPPTRDDLVTLLSLEAGQAAVRIEEARGHCSAIETIYEVHLKRWIHDALDPVGAGALERMFTALHDADLSVMFRAAEINAFLMDHARTTLDFLMIDDTVSANGIVAKARDEALPFRREVFVELATLRRFEAAFRRSARVI